MFIIRKNACQALVNRDGSKPKVVKSIGMQSSILVSEYLNETQAIAIKAGSLLQLNLASLPKDISSKIKLCISEFAGIKFKTGNLRTSKKFLHYVDSFVIKVIARLTPMVLTIILCEEKYGYTPNDLRNGTRARESRDRTRRINL